VCCRTAQRTANNSRCVSLPDFSRYVEKLTWNLTSFPSREGRKIKASLLVGATVYTQVWSPCPTTFWSPLTPLKKGGTRIKVPLFKLSITHIFLNISRVLTHVSRTLIRSFFILRYFIGCAIEIVKRSDDTSGFKVLPRRWVVERTLAWLGRYRRLSKDYEYHPQTSETMIYAAMTHLMLRRLARNYSRSTA
jgi:putative transposase